MTIAMMFLALSGCTHPSPQNSETPLHTWRILERVGNVRAIRDVTSTGGTALRPGDRVADDDLLTTGQGALLILAGDGVQLTAGEDTVLKLSTTTLRLDRGWLRVRLERAANRHMRIETGEFDLTASNSMMTLRAGPFQHDVSVEKGRIRLATVDGHHHATLEEGAAARIDQASGNDLLIRRASGEPFVKQALHPSSDQSRSVSETFSNADQVSSGADAGEAEPEGASFDATTAPAPNAAIRPASRLKDSEANRPSSPAPVQHVEFQSDALMTESPNRQPVGLAVGTVMQDKGLPAAASGGEWSDDTSDSNVPAVDPVWLQFERLTKGLVDQL